MKKYLILLIVFIITLNSQNTETVISAKEVLQLQIEQAKIKAQKMTNDTLKIVYKKPLLVKKSSMVIAPIVKNIKQTTKTKELVNNSQLVKIFILIEILLIALIIVTYLRRKKYFVKLDEQELKSNIKNLRTERALVYENYELSSLRQKLLNFNINIKDGAKSITSLAKKLKIGKGEVHLAAKLKLLMDKE